MTDYNSLKDAVEKRAAVSGVPYLKEDDAYSHQCLRTGLIITHVSFPTLEVVPVMW